MALKVTFVEVTEVPKRAGGKGGQREELLNEFLASGMKSAELQGFKKANQSAYNKAAKDAGLPVHLVTREGKVYITRTES